MTRNIHQIPVRQHNEDRIRRAESWLRRSEVAEANRQQAVSDEDRAATFATGWGRSQVRDGSRIMASLVPEIIKIMQTDMEKNPDADTWGAVAFPRVNEGPDEGIR